ncbi:hypothetical protein BUALT_Bualt12G0062800 [Buddleja alternifolia]|uniref:Uncharacterized protein n=1 Tax=Buddleja alternifolia TaxID=168488 RepID=A0AAV6WZQ3_9LAMI|nr:hypothetical protein BUALT_Bualt12G0062800 [Buddleja alternifolia]
MSEACYDRIMSMMKDILPQDEKWPSSFYETKKELSKLGLAYEKIDACCLALLAHNTMTAKVVHVMSLLWVRQLKPPDGYASNIARCVKEEECKFYGLKGHECHVFMQRLLPIVFRNLLSKAVWEPITELSCFFRDIGATKLRVTNMEQLELSIVETLYYLRHPTWGSRSRVRGEWLVVYKIKARNRIDIPHIEEHDNIDQSMREGPFQEMESTVCEPRTNMHDVDEDHNPLNPNLDLQDVNPNDNLELICRRVHSDVARRGRGSNDFSMEHQEEMQDAPSVGVDGLLGSLPNPSIGIVRVKASNSIDFFTNSSVSFNQVQEHIEPLGRDNDQLSKSEQELLEQPNNVDPLSRSSVGHPSRIRRCGLNPGTPHPEEPRR